MKKRVFAVFAYNEESHILRSISSIQNECDNEIYVLVNGCSDNTFEVVSNYAKDNPQVHPVQIDIGDKANAWNHFVHTLNLNAQYYYFLDGDCRITKGSVRKAEEEIESSHNEAVINGLTATPLQTNKKRENTYRHMKATGGLAGNYYLLRDNFVTRLRKNNIMLPKGTIGEDGLIAALAYWNLVPFANWDLNRVIVSEGVTFDYDQMNPLSLTDIRLYFRRKVRYSCRYFQNKIITKCFKDEGLTWLHGDIASKYTRYPELLALKWRGSDTWFDFLALLEIKKDLKD